MHVRRCAVVFLEPREDAGFHLGSLLSGGNGVRRQRRWLALAPHLEAEIEIDEAARQLLGLVGPAQWVERTTLADDWQPVIEWLLDAGLLIGDDARSSIHAERDEAIRATHWWGPAALMHRFGRWQGIDSVAAMQASGTTSAKDLCEKLGAPPAEVLARVPERQRLPLPRVPEDAFDALLAARTTCRNFDTERAVPLPLLAQLMQRVFAAQATAVVQDDAVFLKKNAPSGGGLHATAAYLLVRNVEGLAAGLYHYHPLDHALEPLPALEEPLDVFARRALAGQHWFADAPVQVVLAPRYARSFWKYRNHPKAYRALILDAGHLSQLLYTCATESGLGAFVTSAINEVDIERALGMDPLQEGPLAVCGFGWRAARMQTAEFDPAGRMRKSSAGAWHG